MSLNPKKLSALVQREARKLAAPALHKPSVASAEPAPEDPPAEDPSDELDDDEDVGGDFDQDLLDEDDIEDIADMIDDGEGDEQLVRLSDELAQDVAEFGEDDSIPPEWALRPEVWNAAQKAVQPLWKDHKNPWAVVAHVYKQMGGTFS